MRPIQSICIMLVALSACGEDAPDRVPDATPDAPAPSPPPVVSQEVFPSGDMPLRGFLDRRGLIHAHSVYSHDACDGMPEVDGVRDEVCFDDFRRGLCQAQHDFVMLTDHRDAFSGTEFPEVLLYRPDRGDELVEHDGQTTASWAECPDGHRTLILAGTEAGTMPVGLEGHVAPRETRSGIYGDASAEAVEALKAAGAVTLIQHTEDWTPEQLVELPVDGFEMFNLHATSFLALGEIVTLSLRLEQGRFEGLPQPDLAVLAVLTEDERYLSIWGSVLARGVRRVTTMGTDCHRNSFRTLMADGERIDSYRRMMIWFSNHLLVRPETDGSFDDRSLKEALRAGRLYGAFEAIGYPAGFDFHARVGESIHEMGEELMLAEGLELFVAQPSIRGLDPDGPQPELTLRVLRAREGGWDIVGSSTDATLRVPIDETGAYRAEVRMKAWHLEEHLGEDGAELAAVDRVWIYSNAIYVR